MFLHRLKLEFAENLKLLIAIWVVFGIIAWSFYQWWSSPLAEHESAQGTISGIGLLVATVILILFVATLFKRDDLKHPQEFWVTRPVRALTFFGTKLVFAWLVIALPFVVLITVFGVIAGVGLSAVWNALELMMWVCLMTNLLALSCMARPGKIALYGFAFFIGGVILGGIILINAPFKNLLYSFVVSDWQMSWNLFIMLIALNLWFGWKCWRLIRDKHTNQRALPMAVLGFLTVLVIVFIPIPGKPATTMPAVTQSLPQSYHTTVGEKFGAKFAAFKIMLHTGDAVTENECYIVDTNLYVMGQDDEMLRVVAELKNYFDDEKKSIGENLSLHLMVLDRKPGIERSISALTSDWRIDEIMKGLPLRKVRIQGTITINQLHYRELARSPIDQPFERRQGGIICAYYPDSSPNEYYSAWKIFSPPSALADAGRRWELARFRMEDKALLRFSPTYPGFNRSKGAFFGSYQINDYHIIDDKVIESDYNWTLRKESGYEKSVQEWKKDLRLVFEVVDRVTPLIIPVDVEVDVPDPSKVRELLKNGTL